MARTPGSNTIAYYPLNGNLNDESGNGYNLTVGSGTASYTTLGTGIKCANLDSYWYARNTSLTTTVNTISFWYARTQWLSTSNDWNQLLEMAGTDGGCWRIRTYTRVNNATPGLGWAITNSSGLHYYKADRDYTAITDLNRHHIVVTTNGSSTYLYIDGNQVVSWSGNLNPSRYFSIGSPQSTYRAFAKMSNVILENKLRTATEVKSYYNDTARQYGLAPKPTIYYGSSPIKEIYYGTGVEAWDTQGPAPDGYHVPLQTEWQSVYDAGVALGQWSSDGNGMRIKLKLPFAGYRNRSTSNVSNQGSTGHYWSSTAYSADNAYDLYFSSSSLCPQDWDNRAYGFSVRCFRNSPLKPSSSWTIIHAGSNGAGIFHNPTEGVISISSDGITWITIADKNLGATTVYNNGDSLSEANCGKYYQRGNNYGFPRTGTVTTSSTKVNASTYGPGNYYSSSTFITISASPYDWSSVQNDNLWGGVTQGVNPWAKKIKAVYYGSKKIRPAGYTPTSNTIAYYPLNGNLNDESGNGYNLTVGSGTASYTTLGTGIKCANLDNYWYARNTSLTTTVNTISFWYARTQWLSTSNDWNQLLEMAGTDGGCWRIRTYTRVNNATPGLGWAITNSSGLHYYKADRDYTAITDLNRHHIVVTTNGSSTYLYIDGNQVASWSGNLNPSRYFSIGSPQSTYRAFAKMSNVILENKLRTATEVQSYYNNTKSKYGL